MKIGFSGIGKIAIDRHALDMLVLDVWAPFPMPSCNRLQKRPALFRRTLVHQKRGARE